MRPTVGDPDDWGRHHRPTRIEASRPEVSLVARDDGVVQLACEGRLTPLPDCLRADPLADVLGALPSVRSVLLDLSRTDYINSTGISWLIQAYKQLGRMGGTLILHSLTPQVRSALELVNLLAVFRVASDRPAALAAASSASHEG